MLALAPPILTPYYDIIKWTGLHTTEAEAAGWRHFIVLVADVYEKRTGRFSKTFFALPAL